MVWENELMSDSDLNFLADFWRMAVPPALRQFERLAASYFLGSKQSPDAMQHLYPRTLDHSEGTAMFVRFFMGGMPNSLLAQSLRELRVCGDVLQIRGP